MSPEDKEKYSNAVPQSFDEIMCGVMLGELTQGGGGREKCK
jgi:hypothetical protein